jgi:transaldolase
LWQLAEIGIDIDQVTQRLEEDGIKKFVTPFDHLMQLLEQEHVVAMGANH